jgi:hypothetical protein
MGILKQKSCPEPAGERLSTLEVKPSITISTDILHRLVIKHCHLRIVIGWLKETVSRDIYNIFELFRER